MKVIRNVFILTTEYHCLLSISIIHDNFTDSAADNVLVFTGKRLSQIDVKSLPPSVQVVNLIDQEWTKAGVSQFSKGADNVFVFTAYRDLETYVLIQSEGRAKRHLVQDGANFYFNILKPVFLSRVKETIKIYRNLWRRGILLKRFVLYKKHLAQCDFIDYVWITNPEVYQQPSVSRKPTCLVKLSLSPNSRHDTYKVFGSEIESFSNAIIYLSAIMTDETEIRSEIEQLTILLSRVPHERLLIKLHPNASETQTALFQSVFHGSVLKNFTPAELYIANARDSYIVGTASAALFFCNPTCFYFSLLSPYQRIGLFPKWIQVNFPSHVNVIEHYDDIVQIKRNLDNDQNRI
jgi:hypothetical protein